MIRAPGGTPASNGAGLRAVLFDAAGTLIHLREPVGTTYARFFRAHGVTLPEGHVEDAFRRTMRSLPPMVFPDAPAAEIPDRERHWWREVVRRTLRAADGTARLRDFDACFDALFSHYAGPEAWAPAPGAGDRLLALRGRGLRLALLSNFDHRLPDLLERLGLREPFERVFLPGEARAAKPDPAFFAFALRALGVAPAEAAYVGDDPADDHEGARRAGLRAVDVRALATLADLIPTPDRGETDA